MEAKTNTMIQRVLLFLLVAIVSTYSLAQQQKGKTFCAYLYNNEYEVYMRINLYEQDIIVEGHDLYGTLPGYLAKKHNSYCWLITSSEIKNERKAELQIINDTGSEDLTATLTCLNDSTYLLKQGEGSSIKIPWNGKWRKLPKTLELKKR